MTVINLEQYEEEKERQILEGLIAEQRAEIEAVEREIEALEYTRTMLQGKLYRYLDSLDEEEDKDKDEDETESEIETEGLEFTCPECGSHALRAVHAGITVFSEIESISADGGISYSYGEYEAMDLSDEASYCCGECYYDLEDETGRPIIGEYKLIEWLKSNDCEEEAAESGE